MLRNLFKKEMVKIIQRVTADKTFEPVIVLLGPYYMNDFTLGGESWSHADLDLFKKFNKGIEQVAKELDRLYWDLLNAGGH